MRRTHVLLLLPLLVACAGCDDKQAAQIDKIVEAGVATPAATKSAAIEPPPRAPDIIVDNAYVAIGSDRVPATEPALADKIGVFLNGRPVIEGHPIDFIVMRNAKPSHAVAVAAALAHAKAASAGVKTETRDGKTTRVAVSFAKGVADCAAVAWIGHDASINVWPAGGGTAKRQAHGMAGPDMTLGTELVRKQWQAGACGASQLVVGADDAMSWGLVFDLATMSLEAPGARVNEVLLVRDAVPGRKLVIE